MLNIMDLSSAEIMFYADLNFYCGSIWWPDT